MRDILYLHGAGDTGDEPNNLFDYLNAELSPQFRLQRPQLPEDGSKWVEAIEALVAPLQDDAIIIGHSFGASSLLQMIATRKPGLRAAAFILIAPPFWGESEWEYEEFVLPDDFSESLHGIGQIYHLQSRDDEIVDFSHQKVYEESMPQASYLAFEGYGHSFDRGDRAPLLELIRSL